MVVKLSISLPEHVYSLASQRTRLFYGNNFSNYINSLVCKDFTETELINTFKENTKPIWEKHSKIAEFESTCQYCRQSINAGEEICMAKFEDGNSSWVHKTCCREE